MAPVKRKYATRKASKKTRLCTEQSESPQLVSSTEQSEKSQLLAGTEQSEKSQLLVVSSIQCPEYAGENINGTEGPQPSQFLADIEDQGPGSSVNAGEKADDIEDQGPGSSVNAGEKADVNCGVAEETLYRVETLLKLSFNKRVKRYPVTLTELKRRCGSPEYMSINSINSYLRINKNKKQELKRYLTENLELKLSPVTSVTSCFSKIVEGEASALADDFSILAARFISFKNASKSEPEDKTQQHLVNKECRKQLSSIKEEIKAESEMFNTATHGMGFAVIDIVAAIFDKALSLKDN